MDKVTSTGTMSVEYSHEGDMLAELLDMYEQGAASLPPSPDRVGRVVGEQLGEGHRGRHSPTGAAIVFRVDETRQTASDTIGHVDRDPGERDRDGIVGIGNIATPGR